MKSILQTLKIPWKSTCKKLYQSSIRRQEQMKLNFRLSLFRHILETHFFNRKNLRNILSLSLKSNMLQKKSLIRNSIRWKKKLMHGFSRLTHAFSRLTHALSQWKTNLIWWNKNFSNWLISYKKNEKNK